MSRILKVFTYPAKEELLSAEDRITVGRTIQNSLVIADDSMSRSHAEFRFFGNDWTIADLGSTNGTVLNGTYLIPKEIYLVRSGDQVSFGSYLVEVREDKRETNKYSLLIFGSGQYEGNFVIGEGTTFSYGGPQATIRNSSEINNDLIFTIRIDEGKLILSPKIISTDLVINNKPINSITTLSDRDIIKIGTHLLLVSVPSSTGFNLNANFDNNQNVDSNTATEMDLPDYLKDRISHDAWNDPKGRRRKSTQSMLSMDVISDHDRKSESVANSYSAAELGANRFSRPNLETIKYQQEEKDKRAALMGIITLVILLGMFSILFNLYYRVIF